jgi:hypothetical protein
MSVRDLPFTPAEHEAWIRLMEQDEQLERLRDAWPRWIISRHAGGWVGYLRGTDVSLAAASVAELGDAIATGSATGCAQGQLLG